MPTAHPINRGRLWVYMPPENRKKLAKLIVLQGTSYRQLAAASGYASHAMIVHLIKGRKNGVTLDAATKMTRFLGVDLFDLFVPRSSQEMQLFDASVKTSPPKPKKVA